MSPALTPELAVAYLRELTCDLRAVAVRGPGGRLLAGEEPPEGAAVGVAEGEVEVSLSLGPLGLPDLARHDAQMVARALAAGGDEA